MTPEASDLRRACLYVIAADEDVLFAVASGHALHFARVLFALTASADPVVQAAVTDAVRVAVGGDR